MSWNQLPSQAIIQDTAEAMRQRRFNVTVVENAEAALQTLKDHIPAEAVSVMTGSSTTLNQIGFSDYLGGGEHPWNNLGAKVWGENDDAKRHQLRRESVAADYFVASVNAIARTGELVAVDASGSRVSAFPFAAGKLLLVVGAQKIVEDVPSAMQRIREYVYPLEDARAQEAYGMGSMFGKWVIIEGEVDPSRIHVILVNEALGF